MHYYICFAITANFTIFTLFLLLIYFILNNINVVSIIYHLVVQTNTSSITVFTVIVSCILMLFSITFVNIMNS